MPHKRKELNIPGSSLWYLVGLITSDGCLSLDGRHIDITAKERRFLEKIKDSIGITNKAGLKNKSAANEAYRIEFSNKNLYEFLLSVGLTPCKSLTQDEVIVPDEFFHDFLRGVIDGDGCIRSWDHPANKREQWSLRIYSPSLFFVEWLHREIAYLFKAKGRIHKYAKKKPLVDMFILKYGKMAAKAILSRCYYGNALSLDRKARLAEKCCSSVDVWSHSKTLFN
ncbi:MAG: LAGLIDADG family homing endonuclease [Candidatus Omnitrophica bacterium]|nr:LAGLIDADG family homing endonuclease [Candidatus Omnitrophota bacterium]MDD5436177.1 LAGLIDADG family homing endonuclease [Candidatus Omnitrophota bacterium]